MIRVVYAPFAPSPNLPEAASPLDGIVCPSIMAGLMGAFALASIWPLIK